MKTLLTFATVALAATTFAAGPKEGPSPHGSRVNLEGGFNDPIVFMVSNPKIAEKIGLTDEQREKIKEINKSNRDNTQEQRKALREAMENQARLLKADKIDEIAIMAEIDKAFDARKELAKNQTKRIIAIRAILTPDQVSKALEAFKNRPNHKFGKENGRRGKGGEGEKTSPEKKD